MGRYSIFHIFEKEPIAIAGFVRSTLFVLVLLGAVALNEEQLAAIAIAMELLLGLFARSQSTSNTQPNLAVGTSVNEGSAVVASVDPPPGPTAEAGNA